MLEPTVGVLHGPVHGQGPVPVFVLVRNREEDTTLMPNLKGRLTIVNDDDSHGHTPACGPDHNLNLNLNPDPDLNPIQGREEPPLIFVVPVPVLARTRAQNANLSPQTTTDTAIAIAVTMAINTDKQIQTQSSSPTACKTYRSVAQRTRSMKRRDHTGIFLLTRERDGPVRWRVMRITIMVGVLSQK